MFIKSVVTFLIIVVLIKLFVSTKGHIIPDKWWERSDAQYYGYPSYSYWEAFQNPKPIAKAESELIETPLLDYRPNGPSPTDVHRMDPYHLLSDVMQSDKDVLAKTTSKSCYDADFEPTVSKVGNYRQTTNNYKRNYPDSCSGWNQELTANFYKAQ